MLVFTPVSAQQSTATPQSLIDRVEHYYDINKSGRKHGCNWYRVLIAFGSTRPAYTLPTYIGPDGSCSMVAYTADEARNGEKIWTGWRPIREELERLEDAQSVSVDPPKAQRSESQDSSQTVYTITVIMPDSVTEGDGGTQQTVVLDSSISPVPSHSIVVRVKGSTSAGTARPSNWNNGPVWSDGSANPHWDYAFQTGNFDTGYTVTFPAGGSGGSMGNISIHNDAIHEGDETVGVVVTCESGCSGSNYTVNIVNDATPTVIKDNDPAPVYTLSAPSDVEEGSSFDVTVNSDRKAQSSLTVPVLVDDVNDIGYITDGTNQVTLDPYSQSGTLTLSTSAVASFRIKDTITATLQNPAVGSVGSPASATVEVVDSGTKPRLSMTAPEVTEGEDIVIVVTADKAANADYEFQLVMSPTGINREVAGANIGGKSSEKVQGIMLAGQTTARVRSTTVNDNRKSGDGLFLISFADNLYYRVGSPIVNYRLRDSEHQPDATIEFTDTSCQQTGQSGNTLLEDNGVFRCFLQSDIPTAKISINYQLLEGSESDIIPADNEKGVFEWEPPYDTLKTLHLPSDGDHIDEPGGTAIIELLPGDGYVLGDRTRREIVTVDDDDFFSDNPVTTQIALFEHEPFTEASSGINVDNINDILGGILEIRINLPKAYYQTKEFRVEVQQNFPGLSILDPKYIEEDGGRTYLRENIRLTPLTKSAIMRIPLASVIPDNLDFTGGNEKFIQEYLVFVVQHSDSCSNCNPIRANLTYKIYPPSPPIAPDDPDHIVNAHAYTARQCVEKNIPRGVVCGGQSRKVIIDMPDEAVEDDAYAYLYSNAYEDLQIRVTRTNKNTGEVSMSEITLPPQGLKYDLGLDNERDERDRDLEYRFDTLGASTWVIHPDDARKSIKIIDDEPTTLSWTTNTLTNTPDEGGFERIAKFAIKKGTGEAEENSFWEAADVMTWDFNFGGNINLVSARPKVCLNVREADKVACNMSPSQDSKGVAEVTIPVWVTLDDNSVAGRSTRTSLDSFTLTGKTKPGNGWVMIMMVGEDTNDVDEIMTSDLQITLSQSGGGVVFEEGLEFPSAFIIYDDEKTHATDDIFSNLNDKTLYISFTRDKYQILEDQGPGQAVILYYNKDNDGNIIDLCVSGTMSDQFTNCVTDSAGVNIRRTTLKDTFPIYVKVTGGSASGGSTSDDSRDYNALPQEGARVLLVPGQDTSSVKFDLILSDDDDDYVNEYKCNTGFYTPDEHTANCSGVTRDSGNETVEFSIDTTGLPSWIRVDPDGHGSTTMEILNSERDVVTREQAQAKANTCNVNHDDYDSTAECNKPVLEIVEVTPSSFAEDSIGWTTLKVRNASTKNKLQQAFIHFKLQGECVRDGEVSLVFPHRWDLGKGSQGGQNVNLNSGDGRIDTTKILYKDNLDCKVKYTLTPTEDYLVSGTPKIVTLRDIDPTGVYLNLPYSSEGQVIPDIVDGSDHKDLSFAVILRQANYENNGVYTQASNRQLQQGEQIEVRIKAEVNGQALDTDKYKIVSFENQSNLSINKLSGTNGYSITMKHVSGSTPIRLNCSSDSGYTSRNINHIACLSLQTAMDIEDEKESQISLFIDYSHQGSTTLSGGYADIASDSGKQDSRRTSDGKVTFNTASFSHPKSPDGQQSDAKKLFLMAQQTTIEEPEPDPKARTSREQPWIDVPMDVAMRPGPSENGVTGFKFCVVKDETTAGYHHDWRIVHKLEEHHKVAVGGYAWDPSTGCTKGSFPASAKERYYLRVHGDSHDEGTETISMYLKISSTNDTVTSGTTKQTPLVFTITNEGPLPGDYLAYIGHSIAAETVAVMESRMRTDRAGKDTHRPRIEFGSMPSEDSPITDPDELLEGSRVTLTTSSGLSLYSRYTVRHFSTDELSGENTHLTVGMDRHGRKDHRWVYGAMIMSTANEGQYATDYTIDSEMLALIPYVIYDRRFYGALGFGQGEYDHLMEQEKVTAETSWTFAALGIRQEVLQFGVGPQVYVTGDYFHQKIESDSARTSTDGALSSSQSSSYRSRIGLSLSHHLSEHLDFSPSIHYRKEGGDIINDKGVELGFHTHYNRGPWDVSLTYTKTVNNDTNDWDSRSLAVSYTLGRTRTYVTTDGDMTTYGVNHNVTDKASVGVDARGDHSVNGHVRVHW